MRIICCIGAVLLAAAGGGGDRPGPAPQRRSDDLAKEYVYPGAVAHGSTYGGGVTPVYLAAFVTPDDGEKVTDWYQQKVGKVARPRSEGVSWGGYEGHAIRHDTDQPRVDAAAATKPRPVAVSVFTERTAGYTVAVTVSRAAGELHTHIVLTLALHPER